MTNILIRRVKRQSGIRAVDCEEEELKRKRGEERKTYLQRSGAYLIATGCSVLFLGTQAILLLCSLYCVLFVSSIPILAFHTMNKKKKIETNSGPKISLNIYWVLIKQKSELNTLEHVHKHSLAQSKRRIIIQSNNTN